MGIKRFYSGWVGSQFKVEGTPPAPHALDGPEHTGELVTAKQFVLTYTDTVNLVLGPLAASPQVESDVLFTPLGGLAQEYSVDYTVREVTGGVSPGFYVCIGTASTAPGGGAFSGSANPTVGIDSIMSVADKARCVVLNKER
jgi:hypothetical protein